MPHLIFKALPSEQVSQLSKSLPQALATVMQTSTDNFYFELLPTTAFSMGDVISMDPLVQIIWFDRGQEVQDKAAKIITSEIRKITSANDVTVIFQTVSQKNYYENGQHF